MVTLRKDNVTLVETDGGKIKELKLYGYKEIDERGQFIEEENDNKEFEDLKKENKSLKAKVTKLEKKVEELEKVPTE